MATTTEQALARTQQLRLAVLAERRGQDSRALEGFWLTLEVWRSCVDSDRTRVDILLGAGGPSDGVEIDAADKVRYWTTDTPNGTRDTVLLHDHAADHWLAVADGYRDCY